MQDINPTMAYYGGMFAAYMESLSTSTPLTERRVDEIKEDLSHYCEKKIDDSQLTDEEKEEQKRQMKQSLEAYILGAKEEMRREEDEIEVKG